MLRNILFTGLIGGTAYYSQNRPQCCGIIGIVSDKPEVPTKLGKEGSTNLVSELLCDGVELLKNRGYDSAGIVSFTKKNQNSKGQVLTQMVKYADENPLDLNCIEKVILEVKSTMKQCLTGIGHTRWATCGARVAANAHPHFSEDQQIYLVHNGIIGNHAQIKQKYLEGVKFSSQTDSEVIVQILSCFRKQGLSMLQALRKLQEIFTEKSQWGLVVIEKKNPDFIYTSTRGSPILVGFSPCEKQIFVASQKIAFSKEANCYFVTQDHEILELSINIIPKIKQQLIDQGRLLEILDKEVVSKHPPPPFEHFYSYEIRQQAQIAFEPNFKRIKILPFGPFLTMVACGSSYYAAHAAEHAFKKMNCFRKINIIDPVELDQSDIVEHETVILISQSGQTKDLAIIIEECKKKQGVKLIGIINVQGSTIARRCDFPIYIKVGREAAVGATKSFFNQVLNLFQFATEVAEKKKSANPELYEEIRTNLLLVKEMASKTIAIVQEPCQKLAEMLHAKKSIYLIARRQGLAIARQAALKIKELNYIHAQAIGACEFKHGTIALIDSEKNKETVVIVFIFNNSTFQIMMNALDRMLMHKAYVIVVTDCQDRIDCHFKNGNKQQKGFQLYDFIITIPFLKHLSHLLAVIPMQIMVQKIAKIKGINPDTPRNLAKTVTV